MNSGIPYLPIDQFESQDFEDLVKNFDKEKDELPEKVVGGERMLRYLEACNGYTEYVQLVLQGMGMEKYISLFKEEDISIDVLVCMGDDDLKNLGITNSEDRNCIVEHLKQFRIKNNDLIQYKGKDDCVEFDIIEDDLVMTRNVCDHIAELNSYLSYIQSQLSQNPPSDYLICDFETASQFFKFTLNHAMIQSNRMSEILFGGQFEGNNLITYSLKINGSVLPSLVREKLLQCHKREKKLRKKRLIITVLLGIGIGVAVSAVSKKWTSN